MATDSYVFSFLLTRKDECFAMCIFYSFLSLGSRIHWSGGTYIRQWTWTKVKSLVLIICLYALCRYWFVKSSLRPEVREGFTNRKILYICLGVPQFLLLVHFLDALRVYMTKGQFPHLLYQACIDPTSYYSIPFYKLLPFHVIMTFIYVGAGAYSNYYLYMFLRYEKEELVI